VHALDIPCPGPSSGPAAHAASDASSHAGSDELAVALRAAFAERYRAEYGLPPSDDLQLRSLRVRVVRPARPPSAAAGAPPPPYPAPPPHATRAVHFAEAGGFVTTPVHRWSDLTPGAAVAGPAVVQSDDTSVVVIPDRVATVDTNRNLVITRGSMADRR
jgi:N-methylhydantoinase A